MIVTPTRTLGGRPMYAGITTQDTIERGAPMRSYQVAFGRARLLWYEELMTWVCQRARLSLGPWSGWWWARPVWAWEFLLAWENWDC